MANMSTWPPPNSCARGFEHEIQTAELDYQVVEQTTQWRSPARFDQVLEISVSTQHLGTTSFTLTTGFRIAGEEALVATSETVYVHVDTHTLKKAPMPARLREALERGGQSRTSRVRLMLRAGSCAGQARPDSHTLCDSSVQPRSRYCL